MFKFQGLRPYSLYLETLLGLGFEALFAERPLLCLRKHSTLINELKRFLPRVTLR